MTLPSTGADLASRNTAVLYSNESVNDGDYAIQFGSEYIISNYQYDWTDNTSLIQFTWSGRTTFDTRVSPIVIQIYNVNSTSWETLAIINTQPADVDFTKKVTQTTNLSNYYDSNNIVTFRVYQRVV